jgi:DDE superfamily endonuclease
LTGLALVKLPVSAAAVRLRGHAMPTSPLARLGTFRTELHAVFTRRADALFELGDALLCADAFPSLPHLSLEPAHRRGWGSTYDALASGRIDVERLRNLLTSFLTPADPLVFAVDVTTWPRCDAECSPERGYYYRPSRHSAGQPIIAGWAYQWVCQLGFARDSWTAPVDAARLHPADDADQQAACQIRALLARLPADGPVPLLVFDAGYDSAQLTLDLAGASVAVLVRLRSDRCFYADPPPPPAGKTGRPRRHDAKFNCADPATWPTPTATLVCHDDPYGTVTVQAWSGLHPKQHRHPGHGTRAPRPIVRGTIIRVQVERIVLLGPPAYPAAFNAGRRFPGTVGEMRVVETLAPASVRAWLQRIAAAAGPEWLCPLTGLEAWCSVCARWRSCVIPTSSPANPTSQAT